MNITTEDGMTRTVGDRVFNYYDRKAGTITHIMSDGWFDLKQDDGTTALLNGERVCSIAFATTEGWIG